MYREIDVAKASKRFRDGDTKEVDSMQKQIDAHVKRFNNSKKTPLKLMGR